MAATTTSSVTHLGLGQKSLRQTRLLFLLRAPGVLFALFPFLLVLDELFLLLENLKLLLEARFIVNLKLGFAQL